MGFLFFICILGTITVTPLHFLSVEHLKLQERYGTDRGIRIGETLGMISGWGFFFFWSGLWFSPQPRFVIPMLQAGLIPISIINFSVPVVHCLVGTPFFFFGALFGIAGVKETTLKVAETHRTERIVTTGVYSLVRHPQYLGALLAHVGASFLLSAWYSLLSTPITTILVYLISQKEEKELKKEFGEKYEQYKKKVPMLMPKFEYSSSNIQNVE